MRSQICVPFSVDLIQIALEQIKDPCWVVFPTRNAARIARQCFMSNWSLEDCRFLSMSEFRDELLLPAAPAVSDDRRLLCLFQSLTEEDRQHFHINTYFDIVEWGQQFFQFFEELCDESVDPSVLESNLTALGINLLEWQETYLSKVLAIRARYRDMLASLGLTDPIFHLLPGEVSVPIRNTRCVFVNQYYYSKLEQALLDAVEAAGNELVIISQITGCTVDPRVLNSPEIDLYGLNPAEINTRQLSVVECENPDQMALSFLLQQAPALNPLSAPAVLIDSQFGQQAYSALFDPRQFDFGQTRNFVHSGVFDFLSTLQTHLQAMAATIDQRFLPLRLILDACSKGNFIRYYQPEWSLTERSLLLEEIKDLLNRDILYVDNGLNLLQELARDHTYILLPQILGPHFALLESLSVVSSPSELIALIDSPSGLLIKKMCSDTELAFSNVLEQFYQRLANFASLDGSGAVASWTGLFGCEGASLAASVLQLLLESLTSARLSFLQPPSESARRFEINNILDLRGLTYDKSVFFHAIEGVYPSNPAPVWLFNESQRAKLGLKSYDDLRRRERYYFLRQLLSSREAVIYTYRNAEQDIEPGSFVTELLHAAENGGLAGLQPLLSQDRRKMTLLYQASRNKAEAVDLTPDPECGLDRADPDSFFIIPSTPEQDFPDGHLIKASYQSLSQLDKNPFVWYLRHHAKLNRVELRPEETISRKLFGALLHNYISQLLNGLIGRHTSLERLNNALNNPDNLRQVLLEQISKSIYLYKLPQNYNHEFLAGVISDCLVESVRQFYVVFLAPLLRQTAFELLPEQDKMTDLEKTHKVFTSVQWEGAKYQLAIRGIADLRIETPAQNIIVDFKTRGSELNQLLFYEWFYYLLDPDYDRREIVSRFWMILDQTADNSKKTDDAKRANWREKMGNLVTDCLSGGYPLGRTVQNRQDLKAITRADLYRPAQGGEA